MFKPTVSAPTRREFVLLTLLLLTLLSLSRATVNVRESTSSRRVPQKPHGKSPHLHTSDPTLSSQNNDNDNNTEVPTPDSERWRTRISWSNKAVPSTTVVSHVPGWTIFDKLYLSNGTVFIVTDDPEMVPPRKLITSTGTKIGNGAEEVAARLPTDHEMRVVTTDEARELFGTSAEILDGTTWIINDPPQFITHYYHFSAELFFGFWRTYTSLDPHITATGNTLLPSLRRLLFTHADADHWRDYASMNQFVLRSVFPSLTVEYAADWEDRARMGKVWMLDRVVFSDRAAAMMGDGFVRTGRTASEAFSLAGNEYWWSTVRRRIAQVVGLHLEEGEVSDGTGRVSVPVITYISRQEWNRRKLIPSDHDTLVRALSKLHDEYGYEVNVVSMDKLSHAEQLRLAARTTIMMGLHGNGLTSLLWMSPSPHSTVIEFFYPGGFAHDYEYTTNALGMVHYGVWGNRTFTRPEIPPVAYPEGFQGNSIPLDGEVVAKLVVERLRGWGEH